MPPKNIPGENGESSEKQNKISRSTKKSQMISLLENALDDTLLSQNDGFINAKAYNTLKTQEIPTKVREQMHYLKDKDRMGFSEIEDTEIDTEVSDSEIWNEYIKKTQSLRDTRKNIVTRAMSVFQDIENLIPNFRTDFTEKIKHINESKLHDILGHKEKLKQYIEREFHITLTHLRIITTDLQAIFSDIDTIAPALKPRLIDVINTYQNHRINPENSFLKDLFQAYKKHASEERLIEIAEYFGIEFSLKDIIKHNLYTERSEEKFLENIAKETYSEIWDHLEPSEQKKIIGQLRNNSNFYIDLKDDRIDLKKPEREELGELLERELTEKSIDLLGRGDFGSDEILGDLEPRGGKWHDVVLEKMERIFRGDGSPNKIKNLENLQMGSVLIFTNSTGVESIIQIQETDADVGDPIYPGLKFTTIRWENGSLGASSTPQSLSYSQFGQNLKQITKGRVLTLAEFESIKTTDVRKKGKGKNILEIDPNNEKIYDGSLEETEGNLIWFTKKIDELDPDGKKYGLNVGTTFLTHLIDNTGSTFESSMTILGMSDSQITIGNGKTRESTDLKTFLEAAKEQGFKRNAELTNEEDFLKALGDFGVDVKRTRLVDGKLITKIKEEEGHGGHGHGGHDDHTNNHEHEKEVPYEFFQSTQDGTHIRIASIEGGFVAFGEYSSMNSLDDVRKEKAKGDKGKLDKDAEEKLYYWRTVPYGLFLEYLKRNTMKATTDNLLVEKADNYHPHDPHTTSSMLKKWTNSWSIADMIGGVKGLSHGISHFFEKGSKLNASRAALRMGKMFGLPADLMAQLQADEVGNVKEIIEQIIKKIQSLNGPVGRKKALHIVHEVNSRPEEVVAATMYMIQGYGHLYAEDIKYAQGSESFLTALIMACGFKSAAEINEQKAKARKKFKSDIGTEAGGQITEEEMIWGFLKTVDGNASQYPLAGTLVKAMGGPSGWEKAWRKEGYEGAKEKGVRQTADLANGQGRLNKFISALGTHEFVTAFGMMTTIPGKNPAPSLQSAPIIWALMGVSGYASTKLSQEIFQLAASKCHSFHAYGFLRNKVQNDLYKDTFFLALEGIASNDEIQKLKEDIDFLHLDGHDPNDEEFDKKRGLAINRINQLWVKYQGHGLHDRLQGKNSWAIEEMNRTTKNEAEVKKQQKIKDYFHHLGDGEGSGIHGQILSKAEVVRNDDNGWFDQFGYAGSPIIHTTKDHLLSLEWNLNKLRAGGSTTLSLEQNIYERFWPIVVDQFRSLKNNRNIDPELKRRQYDQFRTDVLKQFRYLFNNQAKGGGAIGEARNSMMSQPYYQDLKNMGINIDDIFEIEPTTDSTADFTAWENNGNRIDSSGVQKNIHAGVNHLMMEGAQPTT